MTWAMACAWSGVTGYICSFCWLSWRWRSSLCKTICCCSWNEKISLFMGCYAVVSYVFQQTSCVGWRLIAGNSWRSCCGLRKRKPNKQPIWWGEAHCCPKKSAFIHFLFVGTCEAVGRTPRNKTFKIKKRQEGDLLVAVHPILTPFQPEAGTKDVTHDASPSLSLILLWSRPRQ